MDIRSNMKQKNRAMKRGGRLCVQAEYIYKDRIKALGARWNPEERQWELPFTAENWQSLYMQIPGLVPDEAVRAELMADESDLGRRVPEAPPMPLKNGITPFRHQQAAYAEAICLFLGSGAGQKSGGAAPSQTAACVKEISQKPEAFWGEGAKKVG